LHEYTVVDHPKRTIIFVLVLISIVLSHFINHAIAWLRHFNIEFTYTVGSFAVFGFIYLLFNKWIWKWILFGKPFRFPNLSGEWECTGLSTNAKLDKQFNWDGTTTIAQSWDKILISLKIKSASSASLSLTGGIKYVPGVGYKVSYHYENTPSANADGDMNRHEGFCVLTFSDDLTTADGYYFNHIKERKSYGEMKLKRRAKNV